MDRKLLYSLPCILLAACADPPEKYRDIRHLEMPPTLAIEHTVSIPAEPDTIAKPKAASNTEPAVPQKSANSELAKLIQLVGGEEKPTLQLKTRFDRAWDLIDHGLRLAEIEIVDSNRDAGVFRVSYLAGSQGNDRGFFSSVASYFNDNFEDFEYTLTLDKDKRITEVHVAKVVSASQSTGSENESFHKDDSASLMKLLHKTIIADLEK